MSQVDAGLSHYEFHGFAIVSDDNMIADAAGHMPDDLRNEADWVYFQRELDRAAVVLLGRLSHEAAPNLHRRRKRLIMTSSVTGCDPRPDGWWWNPETMPLSEALQSIVPQGGRIAVPGGKGAFDFILHGRGFDAFHLSRAHGVQLPDGQPLFSCIKELGMPEVAFGNYGMKPLTSMMIDPAANVELTIWCR